MSDPCDRCCGDAKVEWWKPEARLQLALCWHHAKEHGATLLADGWLSKTALPTLPALSVDGATH